jgi:hypothetical protein
MPKNPVTDPITDQEIAFAHLILSGTMNDRRAAEAVGLNPSTAACTKSKPRVRDYMIEHRTAVMEKLIDREAERLRNFTLGRDQILARLWHLANLNPEATRGSIAGQVKAMSMIVAIEGLIPDRRSSPTHTQTASQPAKANIYVSEAMRRQHQVEDRGPGGDTTAAETHTSAPQVPEPESATKPTGDAPSPNPGRQTTSLENPFIYPKGTNWVPDAMGRAYDANLTTSGPLRPPIPPRKSAFARGR